MDPYIEQYGLWADFHDDLIAEIKRGLAPLLPERYFIQMGERAYIVLAGIEGKEGRSFYPDLGVVSGTRQEVGSSTREEVALAEPPAGAEVVSMRAFIDEHFRENFIEIYEVSPELRLVTCIEVLSPSNKRPGSEGWEQYLRKRNSILLGEANLVEIDLLQGGRRMPMVEPWPKSPYYLLVSRKNQGPYCRVWSVDYHQPLPEIPVPLSSPDSDITLALQPMIDAVYERSRYRQRIDYTKPLTPPLAAGDASWLRRQLRGSASATKRTKRPRGGR
jgi:hypothetical protein